MKKDEGSYWCYDGGIVTQCSIWDILNDKEEKQMKKLIRKISERSKHPNTVKVTFSVEIMEEKVWEQ